MAAGAGEHLGPDHANRLRSTATAAPGQLGQSLRHHGGAMARTPAFLELR
ncbi:MULTISPECIES: hypothetical protein [unclassified Streptomyces]